MSMSFAITTTTIGAKMWRILTLKVFDNAPQTVAMSSNQHPFAIFDLWDNLFIPEWQCPCNCVLKALTGR